MRFTRWQTTSGVRTGDTPQSGRANLTRNAPHTLVTTPESLYILLTSESGRRMLRNVRTLIVDEIHAVADDKRGSHGRHPPERTCELDAQRSAHPGHHARITLHSAHQ